MIPNRVPEIELVLLERLKLKARCSLDPEMIDFLHIDVAMDHYAMHLLCDLSVFIYKQDGPGYQQVYDFSLPATWWDWLKHDIAHRWPALLRRRWGRSLLRWNLRTHKIRFVVSPSAWYPRLTERDGKQFKVVMKYPVMPLLSDLKDDLDDAH